MAVTSAAKAEPDPPEAVDFRSSQQSVDAASIKPVELILNGLARERPSLAASLGDRLLVPRDDLLALGLSVPADIGCVPLDGQDFVAVSAVPGLAASFSEDGTSLFLRAGADAFRETRRYTLDPDRSPPISPPVPLAFLGYDLSLSRSAGKVEASGLLDLGGSGGWGLIGTTLILPPSGRAVRLDSAFQRDFPGKRLRVTVGDTFTRGGEFNSSLRFGGIRFESEFALAPGEITSPLPILTGSALLPSTVELLAASGRQTVAVAAGRFLIDAPPTLTGAGEVTMTIEDATGAVRQVRRSFYSSARMLRPGLDDFSLEAGLLRRRYGSRSFAYGKPFAGGSWRRGITRGLTAGARVEASKSAAMAGITLVSSLFDLAEIGLAAGASRRASRPGTTWRAQVQRLGRRGSFTASYQRSSAGFAQVGEALAQGRARGRHELSATAGLSLPLGKVSLGLVDARLRDGSSYRLHSLGYSASVGTLTLLASLGSARFANGREKGFFLSLTRPVGRAGSAAMSAEKGSLTSSFQHSAQDESGLNFGFAAMRGRGGGRANAYVLARSPFGDLELSAARSKRGFEARASAHGGLVMVRNRLLATPRIEDGLAVVEVAGDRGVRVLREGRPVPARAGAGRFVVLTGLQPYAGNRVAIRTDDLPLEVEIDDDVQWAVPGFRQAAAIRFGRARSAAPLTVRLVDEMGEPLPAGLEVQVDGTRTGLTGHDGLVFLQPAGGAARMTILGAGKNCAATIPAAATQAADGIAGPFRCVEQRLAQVGG